MSDDRKLPSIREIPNEGNDSKSNETIIDNRENELGSLNQHPTSSTTKNTKSDTKKKSEKGEKDVKKSKSEKSKKKKRSRRDKNEKEDKSSKSGKSDVSNDESETVSSEENESQGEEDEPTTENDSESQKEESKDESEDQEEEPNNENGVDDPEPEVDDSSNEDWMELARKYGRNIKKAVKWGGKPARNAYRRIRKLLARSNNSSSIEEPQPGPSNVDKKSKTPKQVVSSATGYSKPRRESKKLGTISEEVHAQVHDENSHVNIRPDQFVEELKKRVDRHSKNLPIKVKTEEKIEEKTEKEEKREESELNDKKELIDESANEMKVIKKSPEMGFEFLKKGEYGPSTSKQ